MNFKSNPSIDFVTLCVVSILAAVFVLLNGQDRNWDLLSYHYYQGYSLLTGRFTVDLAAANLQSFFNPIANILAYLSLKYIPFPFSAWSVLAVQLIAVPAVVAIAKEVSSGFRYSRTLAPASVALTLTFVSPLWWSELGTTFFSSWTAPLVLWGVYFLIAASRNQHCSRRGTLVPGVLFGFAVGLKLTNALFAVSGFLMLIVLFFGSDWRRLASNCAYFLGGCIFGFALTAWWNLYLWSAWGSPVFPLYNAIFKSEFYDLVNFRDMRWYFSSFSDFASFVVQSAFGTNKTSEIPFADVRYLAAVLLVPAVILGKPATPLDRQVVAFVVFMISGFILWAIVLTYQRYLIPVELLLGLLIWIFVVRIVEREWVRTAVMVGITFSALLLVKIPDWGHAPIAFNKKDPFSIEIDAKLTATPARYLVVGVPISYVLPSLHPASVFYGVGFSRQVDELIYTKLRQHSELPLRILARDTDATSLPDPLRRAAFDPLKHSLECDYFRTGLGRYIVCEVLFQKQQAATGSAVMDASYSSRSYLNTKGVLWERGLSVAEPWGRWSEGEQVEIGLTGCLPQGRLKLSIVGHAFGPNVGLPVKIVLGDSELIANFGASETEESHSLINENTCVDKVVIKIPRPTSPQEVGQSNDPRKLGLGFVQFKIFKE